MRWAQLVLVEDDPGNYSPQFWLDYFRRVHADAACLSAGGCVAYYPTQIPLHYRSKWLGDRDSFGELVKGCRAMGMNVVARTDLTRYIRMSAMHIRIGSPWMPPEKSGGMLPIQSFGSPARWALITSIS